MIDGPVADLVRTVVTLTGYEKHLKTRYPDNHEDRLENVAELVSSAAEYDDRDDPRGLVGYLEEVSLLSDVDRADLDAARVSLMTLHTAKGLEFRTVLIAGLEEGLIPHSRSRDSKEELEEERRLLFVGMTRAKEELHLTSATERFRWGDRGYSRRSTFLDEIDPDAVERDDRDDPLVREDRGESRDGFFVDEYVEPSPGEGVRPGMEVRHDHFGIGRILAVSGAGPSARVTIDFRDHGRKRIALAYARLRPLEDPGW
jgi:DNA helicase-2/ATP-dependent DNA helicase PcrA